VATGKKKTKRKRMTAKKNRGCGAKPKVIFESGGIIRRGTPLPGRNKKQGGKCSFKKGRVSEY